ncbi:MAG TPA: hypothetical protein PLW55_13520, partial [Leptospiraceae bacterium]|nr:hypothetical protein [Leptospiraceae bacterium]
FLEMRDAFVCTLEGADKAPFDCGGGSGRQRFSVSHFSPIAGQQISGINYIGLLNAEGIDIANDRTHILVIRRFLKHCDEILAAEGLDCSGAFPEILPRFFMDGIFHKL